MAQKLMKNEMNLWWIFVFHIYIYGPSRRNRKIAIHFNNKLRKLSQKYDLEGSRLFPPLAGKVHDILLSSCRPDQFSFYYISFFPSICWRNQVKYGDILWKYLWYIMQLLILLSDVDVLLNYWKLGLMTKKG